MLVSNKSVYENNTGKCIQNNQRDYEKEGVKSKTITALG